jgi:signal transduction histidine kinase
LAQAFNHLAGQLQENERRKIETLGQVALTLNHELNNAMATIEMQLALLRRPANDKQAIEKCLRQIHENLQRMAKVVESLRQVRRIVLTDYLGGMKMLDLEQSTRQESPTPSS